MATLKIEIEKMTRGEGCLGKAAEDEPIFILRAQDMLAPGLIEVWAENLAAKSSIDNPKVKEAFALAHEMRAWQAMNHCKLPD